MNKTWEQIDKENAEFSQQQLIDAKQKNATDRDFFEAALIAYRSAVQDELIPSRDVNGELRYTVQQGLKAACHGRQDVTAIAITQRSILQRLDSIKSLLLFCGAILLYIAIRVS